MTEKLDREKEKELNNILNGDGIVANMNMIQHPTDKRYYKLDVRTKGKDVIFLSNYIDHNGDKKIDNTRNTCDNCKHQPKANENYLDSCGECSRFYGDYFEPKLN